MSEPSDWILGGSFAGLAALGVAFIGLALYAERCKERREQWAVAHPHEQVEPPTLPTAYRFVERDAVASEQLAELDRLYQGELEQVPALDDEPAIGDFAAAVTEVFTDGKRVRAWVATRVEWPRETYVRARVIAWHSALDQCVSHGEQIDIPREAIVSVMHWTGLPGTPS